MADILIKAAEATPADDGGSITGYASTWTREPDYAGDVVARGAFAESIGRIEEEGRVLPLLWNHDSEHLKSYIGTVTELMEDDHGLLFTATFDATEDAQRARELAASGRLCKFSFAYEILEQGPVELDDGRSANELRKLDIHEVSLVMYPANPDTSVVEVKAASASGAKAGRRNSAKDEQALRDILGRLDECADAVRQLIGEQRDEQPEDVDGPADEKAAPRDDDERDELDAQPVPELPDDGPAEPDAEPADPDTDPAEPEDAPADDATGDRADADEPDDTTDTDDAPDEGDTTDADDATDATEDDEGERKPKGRDVEQARIEAYRKALLATYAQ